MFIDACRQNWSWSELDFIRFSKWVLDDWDAKRSFYVFRQQLKKTGRENRAVMSIDSWPEVKLIRAWLYCGIIEYLPWLKREVKFDGGMLLPLHVHAATEEDWQRRLFIDTWPELKLIRASMNCLTEVSPLYVHAATGFTTGLVCLHGNISPICSRGNWSCYSKPVCSHNATEAFCH